MARMKALDVARYFLAKTADEEMGDAISNLKLQKLLYYAQGIHLAVKDEPLFDERLEAWTNGPVVPDVWREFKEHGSGAIPPAEIDSADYAGDLREILDEVYEVYGQYSGWKLKSMTSEEPPWRDTVRAELIKPEKLKEYFKTQVLGDEADG